MNLNSNGPSPPQRFASTARSFQHNLTALFGIVFRGRSPERLHYSKARLIATIVVALGAAVASHRLFFEMSANQALLKLVFELGVVVIGLNRAWAAHPARQRLLKMTLALFLVSAVGDLALCATSVIALQSDLGPLRQLTAVAIMLAQMSGALNSIRFGISVGWRVAAACVLGYVAVSSLLYEFAAQFLG